MSAMFWLFLLVGAVVVFVFVVSRRAELNSKEDAISGSQERQRAGIHNIRRSYVHAPASKKAWVSRWIHYIVESGRCRG